MIKFPQAKKRKRTLIQEAHVSLENGSKYKHSNQYFLGTVVKRACRKKVQDILLAMT